MESEWVFKRWMDGRKAAQLNERVEKLVEWSQSFGELVSDSFGTMGVTMLTARMVGDGYVTNLEKVLRLLENRIVLSIGIHGMGGVGKTTLAKGIYNRLLQASPGRVFWVTVSQEFTIKSLQEKIGRCLNVGLSDEDEEDMRAGRLYRALCEMKNAILILDDVWGNIDLTKVGCPFSEECCTLIMTSRSSDVCHQIGCQEVIEVQKLEEDEAWDLFNQTFKHGKEIELSPQVEEIVKSVANSCDGLPQRINSVAASMRGQTAIHSWNNASVELRRGILVEGNIWLSIRRSSRTLKSNSSSS